MCPSTGEKEAANFHVALPKEALLYLHGAGGFLGSWSELSYKDSAVFST